MQTRCVLTVLPEASYSLAPWPPCSSIQVQASVLLIEDHPALCQYHPVHQALLHSLQSLLSGFAPLLSSGDGTCEGLQVDTVC